MSCHSLSSPGVQLPTGTEWPRPHPWWHQPGDQSPGGHPLWEAEARQCPEWVLLSEELPLSQHHQRRDRPHHHLPLQGVWQVRAVGLGTKSESVMNKCSVEAWPRWSEVSSAKKRTQCFQILPRIILVVCTEPQGGWTLSLTQNMVILISSCLIRTDNFRANL